MMKKYILQRPKRKKKKPRKIQKTWKKFLKTYGNMLWPDG